MSLTKLIRFGGFSLIGAGVATAVFWLLTIPFESFAGPEIPLHPLFLPGQIFHVVGAILAVFGYIGLYLCIRERVGWMGFVAFIVAMLGAIFFFGDGIIALVTFPVLAEHAPALTEATGPMFTGRVLGFYILFFATNMIGMVLLGIAAFRSGLLPRAAALLFIFGGIFSNLPPNPALHFLAIVGGMVWGAGAIWLGYAVSRIAPSVSSSSASVP